MIVIEDRIVEELENYYEQDVKDLIKKVYDATSGHSDLFLSRLGDGLWQILIKSCDGDDLRDRLARIGLAYVDWDEIAERIFNKYKEEVI